MMKARLRVFGAVLCALSVLPTASSLAQEPSGITAPLAGMFTPASGGEPLRVEGNVTVNGQVTTGADGARNVSYSFNWVGTAVGQNSGARYEILGNGTGKVPFDLPLPADAGLNTSFRASSGTTSHRFNILLQGSLDENGKLTALVIRAVVAAP